jgi:hypothetical protein
VKERNSRAEAQRRRGREEAEVFDRMNRINGMKRKRGKFTHSAVQQNATNAKKNHGWHG